APYAPPFAVRRRPPPFDLLPLFAGVDRLPPRAAGPPAVKPPGSSAALIRGGQQDIAVGRIHRDVDEACVVVDELRLRPRLPAVDRLEQAALRICLEDVAGRSHVHDVRVLRVDHDAADVAAVAQAHERPRLTGVGALEDAGAVRGA